MTILKVANRYFEFDEFSGFVESTTAGHFDSSYVSNGLACFTSGADIAQTGQLVLLTPGTDATQWFHFRLYCTDGGYDGSSTTPWLQLVNSSNQAVAELWKNGNVSDASFLRVKGTSDVNSAGMQTWVVNTAYLVDIKCTVSGSTTTVEVYVNGSLVMSATNTANGGRGIPNRLVCRGGNIGYQNLNRANYSEFIIATTSTIGMRLDELQVNSAGFHSDMSGTLTDLNTADPTTGLLSTGAGQRTSWNPVAYAGSGGIVAVVASGRAHRKSGTPSKLAYFLRLGSTDYDGADQTIGESTVWQKVWETNPATSVAWAGADLSGIQVGLKSAA